MGKWIHAVLMMGIIGFVLLFIPDNGTPAVLDTSNLTEIKDKEGLAESIAASLPTRYEAKSAEIALDAVPYKLILPEKLPFEADEFKVMELLDWNEKDGEEIKIELTTIPLDRKDRGWITITADDHKNAVYHNGPTDNLTLSENIAAEFSTEDSSESSWIQWAMDGVQYSIFYSFDGAAYDEEGHKEVLVGLANQMITKIE